MSVKNKRSLVPLIGAETLVPVIELMQINYFRNSKHLQRRYHESNFSSDGSTFSFSALASNDEWFYEGMVKTQIKLDRDNLLVSGKVYPARIRHEQCWRPTQDCINKTKESLIRYCSSLGLNVDIIDVIVQTEQVQYDTSNACFGDCTRAVFFASAVCTR
jgi:hypothetical protein